MRTAFLSGRATHSAKRAFSRILTRIGIAALALGASALLPAQADKLKGAPKPADAGIQDPANGEPMTLVVSLGQQKVDVYRGLSLITTSQVSTGMPGHATKAGVFSIIEKQLTHHSNLYSGAPMPWMNRITWSGTALHAGVVPGYPASHGCIRLPFSFAPKLYKITTVGDNVIVARDRLAPHLIEHPNLFEPLPPPPAPTMVKEEGAPKHQTSNDVAPALPISHLGKLAKADLPVTASDIPSSLDAEAAGERAAPIVKDSPPAIEDTHAHAFDPFAGQPTAGSRAADQAATGHALDEENAPEPSFAKAEPGSASAALDRAESAIAPASDIPLAAATPVANVVPPAAPIAEPRTIASAVPLVAPAAEPKQAEAVRATSGTGTGNLADAERKPESADQAALAANAANIAPKMTPAAPATQALAMPAQANLASGNDLAEAQSALSFVAAKILAGTKQAAIQAAEPRSNAPLRILVTRRTQRDRIIGVQRILAELGYLEPQDFDGTLGKPTVTAVKAFQEANGLAATGAFNDELVTKVYQVAGKGEPPAGHLYVRQDLARVFDAPVSFKDIETPLGTHIFTAMKFAPGDTSTKWMAMSLQGDDSAAALDRLDIPNDIRQKICERLTPGSSLIIADTAINTATLPKGADFLVWANDRSAKTTSVSTDGDASDSQPKKKKKYRTLQGDNGIYGYDSPRNFGRGRPAWPW